MSGVLRNSQRVATRKSAVSSKHTTASKSAGIDQDLGGDAPHVSKLETEVLRLEARGTALVQTEGHELEGVALLEKALRTRARFPTLNSEAWQRAESFVVVCNQLAVRTMQRLDENYVAVANELMAAAERTLCNSVHDPFSGFHPLRQHLLGATLSNSAALTVLNGQGIDAAVVAVEKALAVEAPRPMPLTLFNLAAVYVRQSRFDDAMDAATKAIALSDHYLRLRLHLNSESEQPFAAFVSESASIAVLAHHLISQVGAWTGTWNVAHHHARLALRCAERYLGEHHALTTRAMHRVEAINAALAKGARTIGDPDTPPLVPLQMATFSAPFPPSRLLPFTLVAPLPQIIAEMPVDQSRLPPLFATPTSPSKKQGGAQAPLSLPAIDGARGATSSGPRRPRGTDVSSPATARPPGTASGGHRPRPPAQQQLSNTQPRRTKDGEAATARPSVRGPLPPAVPKPPRAVNASGRTSRASGAQAGDGASEAGTEGSTVPLAERPQATETPDLAAHDPEIETAWATPRTVTTIAKLDFEMYRTLQAEVAGFISEQTSPPGATATASGAIAGQGHQYARQRRHPAGALGFNDADVLQAIQVSDAALDRLSLVRPDHTADDEARWDQAARTIQRWARRVLVKLRRLRREAEIAEHERRVQAATYIARAYRRHLERKAARRVLAEKRRQKRLSNFFGETVQASARAWLSYAVYCRRVEADLAAQLAALRRATREKAAATGIQACWRGHKERKTVALRVGSAAKIQRFWRLFCAYVVSRLIIYQRRCEARLEWKRRDLAALRIQRWFKHFEKQRKAIRERRHRLAAVTEYLDGKVERESMAWRRVAGVDEDMMATRLQRFFRTIQWRKREDIRQRTMRERRTAASKIQRCWRWSKASTIQERKRVQRVQQRATRRRIEEVTEAVLDMQRIARRFLARLEYLRRVSARARRHDAASILQRLVLLVRSRNAAKARDEETRWAAQRYLVASERAYAATKIQSIYRRNRDKAFAEEYRRFMTADRHKYAARIQRAFRFYAARKVRQAILNGQKEQRDKQIAAELELQSARRIQHYIRSFFVRRATRRRAAVPVSKQAVAAMKIQRIARYMIARAHVSRLLQAKAHAKASAQGDEHLMAYAVIIQAAVRRRLLTPKRIEVAKAERQVRAAIRIQRFVRVRWAQRAADDRRMAAEAAFEDGFDDEERVFAVVRIQKIARGALVRARTGKRAKAVTTIARAFRGYKSRQLRDALRERRHASIEAQLAAERNAAAATIQLGWRRRASRRRVTASA